MKALTAVRFQGSRSGAKKLGTQILRLARLQNHLDRLAQVFVRRIHRLVNDEIYEAQSFGVESRKPGGEGHLKVSNAGHDDRLKDAVIGKPPGRRFTDL